MTNKPITGHCLCSAVTIHVDRAKGHDVGACHCRMCQRWSGGLFLAFNAAAGSVHVSGEVTRYASSEFAERAFCATCGSSLWIRDTDRDDADYELMPGLFDEARDWGLESEIYVDRALASARLAGDHRRVTRAEYEAQNSFVEGDNP